MKSRLARALTILALLPVMGILAYVIWLWLLQQEQQQRAGGKKTAPQEILVERGAPQEAGRPQATAPRSQKEQATAADNLKRIEGIGPKIESVLKAAGISTFRALAAKDSDALRAVLRAAGVRANPQSWPDQAALAAAGDWQALDAMQRSLRGGNPAK